jgi:hypothetical protein
MIGLLIAIVGGIMLEMIWQSFELGLDLLSSVALFALEVLLILWELTRLAWSKAKWEWKIWRLRNQVSRI